MTPPRRHGRTLTPADDRFAGDRPSEQTDGEGWLTDDQQLLAFASELDEGADGGEVRMEPSVARKVATALFELLELRAVEHAYKEIREQRAEAERAFARSNNAWDVVRALGLARDGPGRPARHVREELRLYRKLTRTTGAHRRPNGEKIKHWVARPEALTLVAEYYGYEKESTCRDRLGRELTAVRREIRDLEEEGRIVDAELRELASLLLPPPRK